MKHIIHIPKTGGTSINVITLRRPGEWKYDGHNVALRDITEGSVVFSIRDPFSRFLSAVKYLTHLKRQTRGSVNEYIEKSKLRENLLFQPMANWLGTLSEYKQQEHLVEAAIETRCIGPFFAAAGYQVHHKLDSKEHYIEIDETIKEENLLWFKSTYVEDYFLYDYIKTRPYYYNG